MSVEQGDEVAFPAMSPADVEELTDEQQDKQNALKQEGSDALEDGKQEVALEKFTAAIAIGCASALMYSRRAQLLMQMDRPRAAINDCSAALTANPDSAKAFKIRAKGYVKLERLEEAHSDFQTALKIDYDEQTYEDSLEVAAKVKEIQAAAVSNRNKAEEEEYHRKLQESKAAYEAGLKAREGEWKEAKEKEEEKATEKEAKKNEVWCAKECLAQGYCCNDPSVGSNQMLSCAQACKMRATGMSTDVMLSSNGGVCNRNGASGCGVNWYSYYDLCDSCSDLTDKCPHGVEDKSECDFGASLNPPGAEFKKKSLAELLLLESYFTLGGSQDMLASLMASEVEDDATEDRPTEDGSQIMTGLLGFVAGAAVTGLGVTVLRRKSPSQDEYNQIVA